MDSETCCRICLGADSPKRMISPCDCSGMRYAGTQKYVHEHCLKEWQKKSLKMFVSAVYCPVCKASYKTHPKGFTIYPMTAALVLLVIVGVWVSSFVIVGGAIGWMAARWSGMRLQFIVSLRQGEPGRKRLRLIRSGNPVESLRGGVILEATDKISSGIFAGSRIAIILYSYELGALGLILNKKVKIGQQSVRIGVTPTQGPVQLNSVHYLHCNSNAHGVRLCENLYYTALLHPRAEELREYRGYAGWASSQLDGEVASGCWKIQGMVTPADVFTPEPEAATADPSN